MARAGRVRGIRPGRGLRENAVRLIDVRLEEFLAFRGALGEPSNITDLHNMRIAAKRLRYAFEVLEVCFPEGGDLAKQFAAIQEELGEIHDLDVFTGVLRERLERMDGDLEARAVSLAASAATPEDGEARLRELLTGRDSEWRVGSIGLIADSVYRRRARFEAFQERWQSGIEELANRVRAAMADEGNVLSVVTVRDAGSPQPEEQ